MRPSNDSCAYFDFALGGYFLQFRAQEVTSGLHPSEGLPRLIRSGCVDANVTARRRLRVGCIAAPAFRLFRHPRHDP